MGLDLSGRNALVTGGSRRVGREIVLALARAGANVVACYRSDQEAADTLAAELEQIGGKHKLVRADVTVAEDVAALIEECRAHFGTLDIVVNNAGTFGWAPLHELPLAEWNRVVEICLGAAFRVTQESLPLLTSNASVINIGSAAALYGGAARSHYTAAKAGLIGMTRSLCKELGPRGVRVNVVAPGAIAVGENPAQDAALMENYGKLTALQRVTRPEDVVGAVLFLASDLASYVTGETINVDGGL
ncbi:MAG: SDR family NAD(P)-dependent oxidoreductase [Micromonosporaceae bacterium]